MSFLDYPGLQRFYSKLQNVFYSKTAGEALKAQADNTDATKMDLPTNSGTLNQILRSDGNGGSSWGSAASSTEISDAVESWMDDHISENNTVALDDSLTQTGAAAQAKAAGDMIKVASSQPSETTNKLWINTTATETQVPTYAEHQELKSALGEIQAYDSDALGNEVQYLIVGNVTQNKQYRRNADRDILDNNVLSVYPVIPIKKGVTYYYKKLYAYYSKFLYNDGTYKMFSDSTGGDVSGSETAEKDGVACISVLTTNIGVSMFSNRALTHETYYEGIRKLAVNDSGNMLPDAITTDFLFTQKNLFPDSVSVTEGYYKGYSDGLLYTSELYQYTDIFPIKPYGYETGETYILSAHGSLTGTYQIFICFYDSNVKFISGAVASNSSRTFTVPSSAVYMCISYRIAHIGLLQIEKGSTYTTFRKNGTEYELTKKVKQVEALNLESAKMPDAFSYKNIYIKGNVTEGYVRYQTGNDSESETYFISDYFPIEGLTGYVFSLDQEADLETRTFYAFVCFYDVYKTYLSGVQLSNGTVTFTTPQSAVYAVLSTRIIFEDASQIEKGNTAGYFEKPKSVIHSSEQIASENVGPVFHVEKDGSGDFVSLVRAIDAAENFMNATVYVGPGTYDLISELKEFYGNDYFNNIGEASDQRQGIQLKNGIHIIFSSRSKVTANYTGVNEYVMSKFSAFNASTYGFTLENMKLETSNTRYCIHDERGNQNDAYRNVYKNCNMKQDNSNNIGWSSKACIGGGLGTNGEVIVEDSVFESVGADQTASAKYLVSYHNSPDDFNVGARCMVVIRGNYIKDGCSINCSWYGNSHEMTTFVISNNSVGTDIRIHAEGGNPSLYRNIEVFEWNNVVRT